MQLHANTLQSASARRQALAGRTAVPVATHGSTTPQSRRAELVHTAVASTTAEQAVQSGSTYVSQDARRALFGQAQEQATEVEATVKGAFPPWLDGSMLLNGGGSYKGMQHMFDGYAMLSKLRVKGGRVYGSQKYINSKAYEHYRTTGRMRWREFGTPVDAQNPLEYVNSVAEMVGALMLRKQAYTDNASVNIVPLPGGKVLALSETQSSQYIVDVASLATEGPAPVASPTPPDGVPGDLLTAHPKVLRDGSLVNFSRTLPFGGYHVYTQDPRTLMRREIAFVKDRNPAAPAWVHDIAASQNHMVILEAPIYFNMGSLMLGFETEHVYMDWKPEDGMRVIVVPLDGSGKVQIFEGETFFTFHTVNAFEEATPSGTTLHVDTSTYDDVKILNDLLMKNIMTFPGGEASHCHKRRLSIPLGQSPPQRLPLPRPLIKDEGAYGHFHEFPTMNPTRRGLSYRYSWGLGARRPTNLGNALVKFDIQSGTARVWHDAGGLPSEPCFVPTPGPGCAEDDGVLLSIVMSAKGTSFLVALDAASMEEVARAELPYGVPYRFHGTFVPSA